MTPKTIAASFRATGVYPFNREAIQIPEVSKADSDLDKGIISYLPLYSPAPKQSKVRTSASAPTVQFSASEEELFKTRHENGYDITTDHRYNQWLLQNTQKEDIHVHSATTINECAHPKEPSSIHEFLQIPELPSALKKNSEKKFRTARVLTSDVAIQQMEEKERRKKEEEERKERRKEEREERARVRAEQQAEKKRKAEEKKKEKEQAERQATSTKQETKGTNAGEGRSGAERETENQNTTREEQETCA